MEERRAKPNKQWTPTCAFCRKQPPEVTMSDEHVFKESLKRLATPGFWPFIRTLYHDFEANEVREHVWQDRNKNPYQVTVRICRDCNTEVLNNLIEVPFADDLEAMATGQTTTLDSDAVMRMATWSAKTAMTRELLDKDQGHPAIPPEQYAWLHDEVRPLSTMLMYFGNAEYTPDSFSRHRRFGFVDGEGRQLPGETGHFTTFVIGHLWVVVAGFGNEEMFNAYGFYVDMFCRSGNQGSLIQFWPRGPDDMNANALGSRHFPPGPEASVETILRVSMGPPELCAGKVGERNSLPLQVIATPLEVLADVERPAGDE
jgi:hypothetical protein